MTGVRMSTIENTPIELSVDGVFIAIGHVPATSIFTEWNMTDAEGYLFVGPYNQQTRVPGVFAAGDSCDRTYRQAGVAAGDGIKAALDAYAFLRTCGYNHLCAEELKPYYSYCSLSVVGELVATACEASIKMLSFFRQ